MCNLKLQASAAALIACIVAAFSFIDLVSCFHSSYPELSLLCKAASPLLSLLCLPTPPLETLLQALLSVLKYPVYV